VAANAGGGNVVSQGTEQLPLDSTPLLVPKTRSLSISRYGTPQSILTYTPSSENAEDGSQEESAVDSVRSTHHNTSTYLDQPGPVSRWASLCPDHQMGLCPRGKTCRFSHYHKSRHPCYAFRKGACSYGEQCKFMHAQQSSSRQGNIHVRQSVTEENSAGSPRIRPGPANLLDAD
jgi:hypothetical protein